MKDFIYELIASGTTPEDLFAGIACLILFPLFVLVIGYGVVG